MASGKIPTRTVLGVPVAVLGLKEIPSAVVSLIERNGEKKKRMKDAYTRG